MIIRMATEDIMIGDAICFSENGIWLRRANQLEGKLVKGFAARFIKKGELVEYSELRNTDDILVSRDISG